MYAARSAAAALPASVSMAAGSFRNFTRYYR